MKRLITTSLLLLTHAVHANPVALTGQFEGVIWSAGILVPSTTSFVQIDPRQAYGHYQMRLHEGEVISGQLHECQPIRSLLWRCIWSDPYGVGTLELELSTDGTRFVGEWRSSSHPHSKVGMDWTGKRVPTTP